MFYQIHPGHYVIHINNNPITYRLLCCLWYSYLIPIDNILRLLILNNTNI
jgi:hypothetical protein